MVDSCKKVENELLYLQTLSKDEKLGFTDMIRLKNTLNQLTAGVFVLF